MQHVLNMAFIKQFISYFFTGGIAAIVEWVMFSVFSGMCSLHYLVSTFLAFIFSTTTNYCLGRAWTFRDNYSYKNKHGKEFFLVFLVSALGLLYNLLLMYLFVNILQLDTKRLQLISKIAATGIVFIWNFLSRKFLIYR